jgi:hypothetical protein
MSEITHSRYLAVILIRLKSIISDTQNSLIRLKSIIPDTQHSLIRLKSIIPDTQHRNCFVEQAHPNLKVAY